MRIASPKPHRSGVTLIEVLVAIFVASIGLLALLALFPVGALSMRQALKDSRCAQCSINGFALFKSLKIGLSPSFNGTTDPFSDGFATSSLYGIRSAALPNGPSYAVYIDPLAYSVKSVNQFLTQDHLPVYPDIPQNSYPRILRSGVSFVGLGGIANYEYWFSLLDDINFDSANGGWPGAVGGGSFTRDPRYTFAYMVRRPYSGNPSTFDVSIVVYAGRSLNTVMGSNEEVACNQCTFTQGSTSVLIPYGGPTTQPNRPNIKSGGWILDASVDGNNNPQAYFYRVVDVVDNGTSLTLELASPAKQTTTNGMVVVLDNVAEVFEKRSISLQ